MASLLNEMYRATVALLLTRDSQKALENFRRVEEELLNAKTNYDQINAAMQAGEERAKHINFVRKRRGWRSGINSPEGEC